MHATVDKLFGIYTKNKSGQVESCEFILVTDRLGMSTQLMGLATRCCGALITHMRCISEQAIVSLCTAHSGFLSVKNRAQEALTYPCISLL